MKKKEKKKYTSRAHVDLGTVVAMTLMILAFASLAGAAIVFTEDWESQAGMGEDPSDPPWDSSDNADDKLKVLTDTGNLFGAGTSNKYYQQEDKGLGGKSAHGYKLFGQDPNAPVKLATVSMDFIEKDFTVDPNGQGFSPNFTLNVMKSGATSNFGGDRVDRLYFEKGNIDTPTNVDPNNINHYQQDTKHHMDWIVNTSGGTVNYGSGQSVAHGTNDVWIDGVLKIDDGANAHGGIDMGGLVLQSGNTGTHGDFQIDNIVIRDDAYVIPEPTSLILLVIGLLTAAAAVCARRRK